MGAISWHEYKDRIKRYFWFTKVELRDFFLLVLFFALIFSFDKWGMDTFNFIDGVKNLVLSLVIVSISVFVHHSSQRLAALYLGYKPENRIWWLGVLIGLAVVIFTNGGIMIFAGCFVMVHMLSAQRLGKYRYGPSMWGFGYVAMLGPLANLLFAGILHVFGSGIGSPLLNSFVSLNIMLAVYNALPLPPLDGSRMFFGSRLSYFFFVGLILGFLVFFYILGISLVFSAIISFLLGIIGWIVFYLKFERFWR